MASVQDMLDRKGSEVWSIGSRATVEEALSSMKEKNVGALVVTDESRTVGILSERDFARRSAELNRRPSDLEVREVMSDIRVEVEPATTVHQCMRIMTDMRVRHLTVKQDERLMGLISIGDVVNTLLLENESVIRHLESYIAGLR